jgi:flagellar biosynthetic protein FliQ
MNEGDLAVNARDALLVLLKVAGPVLSIGLVVGIAISLLQALTQVHEQTLVFIPKLVAVCLTIAVLGGFMLHTLTDYAHGVFDQVISVGLT